MGVVRAVIIEDEAANARNLQFLLQGIDADIKVVKVLPSVKASVEYLTAHLSETDLIFMDIRLTDGVSFEILDKVTIHKPIIFTTAYEEYALKAFNTHGIAYILKPYDTEELTYAVKKYRLLSQGNHTAEIAPDILKTVIREIQNNHNFKQTFLFHFQNRLIPVNATDIAWFYSKNEITKASTFQGRFYYAEETLENLINLLNPTLFFRANRQFIVNRQCIESIDFYFNGRLLIKIQPAAEEAVIVSKAKATAFRNWLDS